MHDLVATLLQLLGAGLAVAAVAAGFGLWPALAVLGVLVFVAGMAW